MIRIRKYRDVEVVLPAVRKCSVGGEFRFKRYNCMGQLNLDTGWEPNRIVNSGLNDLGGLSLYGYPMAYHAAIGTSNAATLDSMTSLAAKVGTSVHYESSFRGSWNTGAPDYAKYVQDGYRFDPGNGVGTIQEVGLDPNDPAKLFARHVISPGISKAADETLDVFYRYAMFPDLTDTTGSTVIDTITYDWVARINNCDFFDWSQNREIQQPAGLRSGFSPQGNVYDGLIGSITTSPAGASASLGSHSEIKNLTYVAGSYYRTHRYYYDLNYGNIAGGLGIRSIVLGTYWFDTQIQFTGVAPSAGARIAKDNTKVFSIDWRTSWTRRS